MEPGPEAATVAAYLDSLCSEERKPKTLSKYTKAFERVAALAAERRVKDLSGIDLAFVDAYRKQRTDDGAAAKTKYTEVTILRQLVTFALSRNMLAADPLRGLKAKKPKPTEQPCWTADQVAAILAAAPEAIRPALVLAETGMRFGELAWLGWDDVDVYTHVHNNASQAAVQRLADANQQLQMKEKPRDGTEAGSAQTQHTEQETDGASDAK